MLGPRMGEKYRRVTDDVLVPIRNSVKPLGRQRTRSCGVPPDEEEELSMTTTHDMPDPLSAEFAVDPHKYYKIMRDEFPVLHHEVSGYYFVSRFDDVARVYT